MLIYINAFGDSNPTFPSSSARVLNTSPAAVARARGAFSRAQAEKFQARLRRAECLPGAEKCDAGTQWLQLWERDPRRGRAVYGASCINPIKYAECEGGPRCIRDMGMHVCASRRGSLPRSRGGYSNRSLTLKLVESFGFSIRMLLFGKEHARMFSLVSIHYRVHCSNLQARFLIITFSYIVWHNCA